ncbi:MAG TPA: TetR/AcrR family transcriptional regulator [Rhizomicrobium sp.]|jgi:AcrR family transcriptional regulator|nr:TetR/AcrR family transcriptional regulator [Rhizomicrobium sp.]
MARTQAADYGERRAAIVDQAAQLFAERGFLGASIADLADACDSSKSLIYHYYASKEDILFDVMHSHVRALLDAAEEVAVGGVPSATMLRDLTGAFMHLYVGAAARHRVLLNELQQLPETQRAAIIAIQRRLIEIVENILEQLRPDLPVALKRPAAMLYFGMINWTHTWLDPEGAAKPKQIAMLAANVFLEGLERGEIPG